MTELLVIRARIVSFVCYVVIGASPVLIQFLDPWRDKPLSGVASGSWAWLAVSTLAAVAVTVKAWLSESAGKARNEITAQTGS